MCFGSRGMSEPSPAGRSMAGGETPPREKDVVQDHARELGLSLIKRNKEFP